MRCLVFHYRRDVRQASAHPPARTEIPHHPPMGDASKPPELSPQGGAASISSGYSSVGWGCGSAPLGPASASLASSAVAGGDSSRRSISGAAPFPAIASSSSASVPGPFSSKSSSSKSSSSKSGSNSSASSSRKPGG